MALTTNEIWTLSIAGYAAVISTFVLGWDAYKWLSSGPKVRLTASTGMQKMGGAIDDPQTYVSVTATNLGDRATTITNLGFMYYRSRLHATFRPRHPAQAFIIPGPTEAQAIPYRFEAGAQWIGLARQDDDILRMIREGALYAVLYTSHHGWGVRHRLTARS
ncbi:hypothetical protein [Variovorax atrisoli]|uniref:hypothetical protein n=1 Tax=Variovorax atrisoli TaxID=3394203 RepID=UPI00403FEE1D